MESKRAYSASAVGARLSAERGFAILLVFILVILLGVVVAALSVTAWHERVIVVHEENRLKASYAATAGVADAENRVWNQFIQSTPVSLDRTIGNFANYLNTSGPGGTPLVANDANGVFDRGADGLPAPGEGTWIRPLTDAVEFDGRTRQTGLHVWRSDAAGVAGGAGSTLLRITSFGEGQEQTGIIESVTQIARVAPATDPLGYAALTRDMTCTMMCHAEIDNAARFFNAESGNVGNYNSYDKVRVGSLRETTMRIHPPDQVGVTEQQSGIAGTLFTRGKIVDRGIPGDYKIMPDSGYLDAFAYAYAAIHEGGKIAEDGAGGLTHELLDPADAAEGPVDEFANFYENYPSGLIAPAGYLPEDVPPVIPERADIDHDGVLTTAELQSYAVELGSQGGLHQAGTISGGVIYAVSQGNQYSGSGLPGAGNMTSIDVTSDTARGVHTGNVILHGTAGNPLVLHGTVMIQGDVVLSGYYEGTGQIYATGNVYIVGDLQHGDSNQYALEPADREHGLLLRADGNILVNDFLSPGLGSDIPTGMNYEEVLQDFNMLDPGGFPRGPAYPALRQPPGGGALVEDPDYNTWSYTADQMAIFNRNEWQKTQVELRDKSGNMVPNPTYDRTYVPTYYRMGPDDPVYIFGGTNAYWHPDGFWDGKWSPTGGYGNIYEDRNQDGVWVAAQDDWNENGFEDKGDLLVFDFAELPGADTSEVPPGAPTYRVKSLAPSSAGGTTWLPSERLKQFFVNQHASRAEGPLLIDAGLHSSNAIIMYARQKTWDGNQDYWDKKNAEWKKYYNRKFKGQVVLNGLVIAPNVAVNAYGDATNPDRTGMRLNYDEWLQVFRNRLDQTQPVELRRVWTTVGTRSGDGDGGQAYVNRRG